MRTFKSRLQLLAGLGAQTRFGEHVFLEEFRDRRGVVPIGLLHRLIDDFELERVDHPHLDALSLHPILEVPRVAGRLNTDPHRLPFPVPKPNLRQKLLVPFFCRQVLPKHPLAHTGEHRELRLVKVNANIDGHRLSPHPIQVRCGGSGPFSYSTSWVME